MFDEIKKQVEEETKESPVLVDNMSIVEKEMVPLTSQLFEIAEKHHIPYMCVIQCATKEEGYQFAQSISVSSKEGASRAMCIVAEETKKILSGDIIMSRDEFKLYVAKLGVGTAMLLKKLEDTGLTKEQEEIMNMILKAQILMAQLVTEQ